MTAADPRRWANAVVDVRPYRIGAEVARRSTSWVLSVDSAVGRSAGRGDVGKCFERDPFATGQAGRRAHRLDSSGAGGVRRAIVRWATAVIGPPERWLPSLSLPKGVAPR